MYLTYQQLPGEGFPIFEDDLTLNPLEVQYASHDLLILFWYFMNFALVTDLLLFFNKFNLLERILVYISWFITLRHYDSGEVLLVCALKNFELFLSYLQVYLHTHGIQIQYLVESKTSVIFRYLHFTHVLACHIQKTCNYPSWWYSTKIVGGIYMSHIFLYFFSNIFGNWFCFWILVPLRFMGMYGFFYKAFRQILISENWQDNHVIHHLPQQQHMYNQRRRVWEMDEDRPVTFPTSATVAVVDRSSTPQFCDRVSLDEYKREAKEETEREIQKLYQFYHENKEDFSQREDWKEAFSKSYDLILSSMSEVISNAIEDTPLADIVLSPCVACLNNNREFACHPCNHLVLCRDCVKHYQELANEADMYTQCPVCRVKVEKSQLKRKSCKMKKRKNK